MKNRRRRVSAAVLRSCSVDPDDARTVYVVSLNDDFASLQLWKSTPPATPVRYVGERKTS